MNNIIVLEYGSQIIIVGFESGIGQSALSRAHAKNSLPYHCQFQFRYLCLIM